LNTYREKSLKDAYSVSLLLRNKYPYNNGHLLVAPKMHKAELEDLSPEEAKDLFRVLILSTKVLKKVLQPEGFNIGMNLGKSAGAGVLDHLHWHIIPRWHGDVNFMPLVSEVKVLPEHLSQTASKLRSYFVKL
jgi:ATP adenylyltransferase